MSPNVTCIPPARPLQTPHARSSSFVTAALLRLRIHRHRTAPSASPPFGNETLSQSSSPATDPAPSPSKPSPPNPTVRVVTDSENHRLRSPSIPKLTAIDNSSQTKTFFGPVAAPSPTHEESPATLFRISKSKYSEPGVRGSVCECCAGEIFDGVGSSIAMGISILRANSKAEADSIAKVISTAKLLATAAVISQAKAAALGVVRRGVRRMGRFQREIDCGSDGVYPGCEGGCGRRRIRGRRRGSISKGSSGSWGLRGRGVR